MANVDLGDLDPGDLVREKEAAHLLSVSHATLRRWRYLGQGPRFYRIGRCVRYRRQDVEQFLANQAVQPKEEK
jgi:excisionase family DNA binding protein